MDKQIALWFMDEACASAKKGRTTDGRGGCAGNARLGERKPTRRFEFALYPFAGVQPSTGEDFALVLPRVSAAAMSTFLAEFAKTVPEDTHAVMVLDQAGWHDTRALSVPASMTLVPLPAYSPELNPVERVWLYLRERYLSHQLLADYDAVVDACCTAGMPSQPKPAASDPSQPTPTSNRSAHRRGGIIPQAASARPRSATRPRSSGRRGRPCRSLRQAHVPPMPAQQSYGLRLKGSAGIPDGWG